MRLEKVGRTLAKLVPRNLELIFGSSLNFVGAVRQRL
jgi:hypothetical protein